MAAKKNGGQVTLEKYGREHFREIARKGYLAAKAKLESQGRNFHQEGGEASWKAQNREMIELGYFPNQTLRQWGYVSSDPAPAPIDNDEPPF